MKCKLLYLPVDKPLEDGCMIATIKGETFEYKESEGRGWSKDSIRVVEPFLVCFEFNEMKVMGRPSPEALKFLKKTEVPEVKSVDCMEYLHDGDGWMPIGDYTGDIGRYRWKCPDYFMWRVKCPTCGVLH